MKSETGIPEEGRSPPAEKLVESEHDQISQNIDAVLDFYTREEKKLTGSQRVMERVSRLSGSRLFSASFFSP